MKSNSYEYTGELDYAERLLIGRWRAGFSNRDVARIILGTTRGQSVSDWERGVHSPRGTKWREEALLALYEHAGWVRPNWIKTGEGSITAIRDADSEAEVMSVVGADTSQVPLGGRGS